MKKLIFVPMLLLAFLLAGCSGDLDIDASKLSSKADELAAKADEIDEVFHDTRDAVDELQEKDRLTARDQERLASQIDEVIVILDDFKTADAPFIVKGTKKLVTKKINEREDILLEVKEKAVNGSATKRDLKRVEKALDDDMNISLFN